MKEKYSKLILHMLFNAAAELSGRISHEIKLHIRPFVHSHIHSFAHLHIRTFAHPSNCTSAHLHILKFANQ